MARYFDVHPDNPQPRALAQVVDILRSGGLVAYPTDSAFALGCTLGNREGLERIRGIRHLDRHHHFTLVCSEFAQLGTYVQMDNWMFRAVKAATPGPYTFVLPATREAPKVMLNDRKKTVGVRLPQHTTALALLSLPRTVGADPADGLEIGHGEARLRRVPDGWTIADTLGHEVDAVLDSGDVGLRPTTVIDLSGEEPAVVRLGAGDPEPFL